MKYLEKMYKAVQLNIFDGEGDDNGQSQNQSQGQGDSQNNQSSQGETQTFTQEQVNSMIAEQNRKNKQTNQDILNQLEMFQTKVQMKDEESQKNRDLIEDLRKKVFTAEELSQQKADELQKQYEAQLADAVSQAESWRNNYTEATVSRSITDAAVKHNAFNPDQIVMQLKPLTRLVEVKDEVSGRIDYRPVVDWATEKDGQSVKLELTPEQAVEQLSKRQDAMNLFKSNVREGFNSSNNGIGGGKVDPSKMSVEDYKEWRKKNLRR